MFVLILNMFLHATILAVYYVMSMYCMMFLVSVSWCLCSCMFHGILVGVSVDTIYPGLPPW